MNKFIIDISIDGLVTGTKVEPLIATDIADQEANCQRLASQMVSELFSRYRERIEKYKDIPPMSLTEYLALPRGPRKEFVPYAKYRREYDFIEVYLKDTPCVTVPATDNIELMLDNNANIVGLKIFNIRKS